MVIQRIGYGAGQRDFDEHANLLRLIVGLTDAGEPEGDQVAVIETNIDDVSAEVIGYCYERLFEAGAFDVYATAIFMKKNRPATKLTVLCRPADIDAVESILFAETPTLGVRRWLADRSKLTRRIVECETPWGRVKGKQVEMPDGSQRVFPEYEDCRRVAAAHKIALQQVLDVVKRAAIV
jgi:uncharacterized protein (DUF111 family)